MTREELPGMLGCQGGADARSDAPLSGKWRGRATPGPGVAFRHVANGPSGWLNHGQGHAQLSVRSPGDVPHHAGDGLRADGSETGVEALASSPDPVSGGAERHLLLPTFDA